jgi:hypothetical protein
MAQYSVWKVTFHLESAAGRVISGPNTSFVGISGGSRTDIHSPSIVSALVTAIGNNLLGILQAQGFSGATAPGGTVVLETFCHASAPDVWT